MERMRMFGLSHNRSGDSCKDLCCASIQIQSSCIRRTRPLISRGRLFPPPPLEKHEVSMKTHPLGTALLSHSPLIIIFALLLPAVSALSSTNLTLPPNADRSRCTPVSLLELRVGTVQCVLLIRRLRPPFFFHLRTNPTRSYLKPTPAITTTYLSLFSKKKNL